MATVVAGYDGSDRALAAVEWAADEAAATGGRLVIGCAKDDGEPDADELAAVARTVDGVEIDTRIVDGDPDDALADLVDETDADLLVLGATGAGALARTVLGSTAAALAHSVSVPMVVVRGDAADGPVVAGLDGTPGGDEAVRFALAYADNHGASVTVVHCRPDASTRAPSEVIADAVSGERVAGAAADQVDAGPVRRRVDELAQDHPQVDVDVAIGFDRPAAELTDHAEGARLLVIGAGDTGLIDRMVTGSVQRAMLYNAPCPVAVVHPR